MAIRSAGPLINLTNDYGRQREGDRHICGNTDGLLGLPMAVSASTASRTHSSVSVRTYAEYMHLGKGITPCIRTAVVRILQLSKYTRTHTRGLYVASDEANEPRARRGRGGKEDRKSQSEPRFLRTRAGEFGRRPSRKWAGGGGVREGDGSVLCRWKISITRLRISNFLSLAPGLLFRFME